MKRRVILIGIPHHNNLGDSAIAHAEEKFINDNFKDFDYLAFPQEDIDCSIDKIKKIINNEDIIFMHGGGNMGCEYIIVEEQRRDVVQTFPNNKIIFFPQTIYFKDNEYEQRELKKSSLIYSKHNNLTIIAREEKSYEIMKENFKSNNVILTPDIVTYLNESEPKEKREGALMVLRHDRERKIDNTQVENIYNMLKKYYSNIIIDDTVRGEEIMLDEEREQRLQEIFDLYRKSEVVITDRLHGMIFAAITETPCIALDNYNHKVSETSKWFDKLGYIKHIKNINNIEDKLLELREIKDKCKYDNQFAISMFKKILENV